MITHPIEPFYDGFSTVLILGSFPSVASRQSGFFYGHKQNRFWQVLASVFDQPVPQSLEQKKELLKKHNIALWDVIASCEIMGSADSTIQNVTPNDLSVILNNSRVERIFLNGKKAYQLYNKHLSRFGDAVCLPSTSPANAAWSLQRLIEAWSIIK